MKRECPEGKCDGAGNMGEGVRGVCFQCLSYSDEFPTSPYTTYCVALLYVRPTEYSLYNVPILEPGVNTLTTEETTRRARAICDPLEPTGVFTLASRAKHVHG